MDRAPALSGGLVGNWFLTEAEKQQLTEWKQTPNDDSVTAKLLKPLRDLALQYCSSTVAPNVLSLTALLCVVQSWYLFQNHGQSHPFAVGVASVCLGIVFWVLSAIAPIHALNEGQDTTVTELFGHACDNISTVFLIVVFCELCGNRNLETQWFAVQIGQYAFMRKHVKAFAKGGNVTHGIFTGPGEMMVLYILIGLINATLGLSWLGDMYLRIWSEASEYAGFPLTDVNDPWQVAHDTMRVVYVISVVALLMRIFTTLGGHYETRVGLTVCMMCRIFPAVQLQWAETNPEWLTMSDVIFDGIFLTVVTSDVCVAKLAKRELHPWLVILSMASVFNHMTIGALVAFYYICTFADMCHYMNLPLLSCARNVYCDGVYDLCHVGHKNAYRNALSFGNRLFVGVCGDADCSAYKRPPIMNHAERCAEVFGCKAVTKIIPNAPCFGLTEEFLKEHKIHVVCMGQEYIDRWPDPKDDKYYSVPRIKGIHRILPRTDTISTSDLIQRIQNAGAAELERAADAK